MNTHSIAPELASHWKPFLEWAQRLRLALLPVRPDTKLPAVKWKVESSFDPAKWHEWLTQGYMLAIDFAKSGMIGLDVDVKHVGRELAWKVYSEYTASLGAPALTPYCLSPSGGWHAMLKRPDGIDPESIRGLLTSRKTSDARPLAAGEKDAELISVRNRGYCVAPGSSFGGALYTLIAEAPHEPVECTEQLIEALQRPSKVSYRPLAGKTSAGKASAAGKAGDCDVADVGELVSFLDKFGEFDERDSRFKALCGIKHALGDTPEALEVAREILHPDTPEEKFLDTWKNRVVTDPNQKPGVNLCTIASMIKRAKELGYKGGVGKSFTKIKFKDVVAELAANANAKLHSTSGGVPLLQGQQAVLDLGRPIVDAFIAANSGSNAAGDAPTLPEEIKDYSLYTDANTAIGLIVALAERSPRLFRADDVVDTLAVIEAIHEETFKLVVARIRASGCTLPENKLNVAVSRFEAAVKRACRTAGGWRIGDKGKPDSQQADNVATLLDHARVTVKFNNWTQRMDVQWPERKLRAFEDHDLNRLIRIASSDYEFNPAKDFLRGQLDVLARDRGYDPVLDRINSLVWDGKPRLASWLSTVCHLPDDPYHSVVGKILIGGAVKRVRHPGCEHPFVPVFLGPEGLNKSTLCKILAFEDRELHIDNLDLHASEQNLYPKMAGKLVIELAEFDKITGAKAASHLKAFVSTTNDSFTPKYHVYAKDQYRRSIFIGTGNQMNPLVDLTGNRRYFPLKCEREFDVEWLRDNLEQLYAEAAYMEAAGETFKLPREMYQTAASKQEGARAQLDYEVHLRHWFAKTHFNDDRNLFAALDFVERPGEFIITADLYSLLQNAVRRSVHPSAVAPVMQSLEFEPAKVWLNGKNTPVWHRGAWRTNGEGMAQHIVTDKGKHAVRPAVPPPPR
jgi:Virulence-associated protein E-like domain/Bifunctional DNA primase/polymerase, N-terminal